MGRLNIIKYLTPTLLEARRIQKLVFLTCELQEEDGAPDLFTGKFEQETPVTRRGLYGNPDVEVHFLVGTHNAALWENESGWHRAIVLYHTVPWPLSLWIAWVIFVWNCWTGKRRVSREEAERVKKS